VSVQWIACLCSG